MAEDLHSRGKTIVTDQDEEAMKCRWVRLKIHAELEDVRGALSLRDGIELSIELEVKDTMAEAEAPSLEAEAEERARSVIESAKAYVDTSRGGRWQDCNASAQDAVASTCTRQPGSSSAPAPGSCPPPQSVARLSDYAGDVSEDWWDDGEWNDEDWEYDQGGNPDTHVQHRGSPVAPLPSTQDGATSLGKAAAPQDKPLVEPPQLSERVKDTERDPYWIPAAFPTIFQNETGDPYNVMNKEVDLNLWGPHILRSRGWHAQAHMTFMYWWSNMMQRVQALSAKKWYVRDNPQATGYTAEDLANMSVGMLSKKMVVRGPLARVCLMRWSPAHGQNTSRRRK